MLEVDLPTANVSHEHCQTVSHAKTQRRKDDPKVFYSFASPLRLCAFA
jgi:hypothetical protein